MSHGEWFQAQKDRIPDWQEKTALYQRQDPFGDAVAHRICLICEICG